VASAADYVSCVADALGIDRFAVMGHSGSGSHALACVELPERVLGAVIVAGLAPLGAEGLEWFAGMSASGAASLRAAAERRVAKERYEASGTEYDPEMFTPEDHAALSGAWSWVLDVVNPAMEAGTDGLIDDLAYVAPWGFDPARAGAPTLFLHGGRDRVVPSSHGEWLARRCPSAELWLSPDDGHISYLNSGAAAMEWLREQAVQG
jgi:pimeloyl-ACP methyl ester carboxylesterase